MKRPSFRLRTWIWVGRFQVSLKRLMSWWRGPQVETVLRMDRNIMELEKRIRAAIEAERRAA